MDTSGNMYISSSGLYRVLKISTANKIVSSFAGSGGGTFSGMQGPATSANIPGTSPYIAADSQGSLFIGTDAYLLRVDGSTKIVSLYAGIYQPFSKCTL